MSFSKLVVYRNGTLIDDNVTTTTYNDPSVLAPNSSYTYKIVAYDTSGNPSSPVYSTIYTSPMLTALSVANKTSSTIGLAYDGSYNNVSISRGGTQLATATNITGKSFTDIGLLGNTTYSYVVTPYNIQGVAGSTMSISQLTYPTITTFTVASESTSQIVLAYDGSYSNVSITRGGTAISVNSIGKSFTDTGLTANTSYVYVITPNNTIGSGPTATLTKMTLPAITSLSVTSVTSSTVILAISGGYTSVSITRNGTSIATGVTGSTYTDTGLTSNTAYTYLVTPVNSAGNGTAGSISTTTLTSLTSLTVSSVTATQIVLAISGSYTSVSVSRDGSVVGTTTTTSYTDTGLSANTSYVYAVTPYNGTVAGSPSNITKITLPNITSLSISSYTSVQIVLAWSGNYTSVNITKNGTSIATGVTAATYTDSGLTVSTSYTYTITPVNSSGNGTALSISQTTLSGAPVTIPPAPTGLTISNITASSFSLGFTATGSPTSYYAYSSAYNIQCRGTSNPLLISTSTITSGSLNSGGTYPFVLYSINSAGQSPASSSISVTLLPGQPTSVKVTINTSYITSTSQVVSFSAPSGGATSYIIKDTNNTVSYSGTSTAPTITGLASNTLYSWLVYAVNSSGTGAASVASTAVATYPAIVTGLVATSMDINSFYMGFNAVTGNAPLTYNINAGGYGLYAAGTTNPCLVSNSTLTTASGSYTIKSYYSYTWTVYAVNSSGKSAASSTLIVTFLPGPPTITVNSSNSTVSSEVLTITAPQGTYTSYIVKDTSNLFTYSGTSGSPTITGLASNTLYSWIGYSVNSTGTSAAGTASTPSATFPSAPTNLVATSITTTSFYVGFTAPTGNVPITSYTAYCSAYNFSANGTTNPFLVSNSNLTTSPQLMKAGGVYPFIVYAYNASGKSVASSSFTVTMLPGVATALVTTAVSSTSQSIAFTTAPGATTYNIISTDGTITQKGFTGTPIVVTGLASNTLYSWTVNAVNVSGTGDVSAASTAVPTLPATPTNIVVSKYTTTGFTVSCTASTGTATISAYTVHLNTGINYTSTTPSIAITGLTQGSSYTYYMYATNSGGNSVYSTTVSGIYTLPGTATSLVAVGTSTTSQTITFTAPSGTSTSYTIVSVDGTVTNTGSSSPIVVTGLSSNTLYSWIVTANNISGAGIPSSASNVVATQPGPPTNIVASVLTTGFTLTFTAPSGTAPITLYTAVVNSVTYTSTTTSITATGLTANKSYTYTLKSTNASGSSVVISGTVTTAIIATITGITNSNPTTSSMTISYTGTYTTVNITQNGVSVSTGSSGGTYSATILTVNTSYVYVITPYNIQGQAGVAVTSSAFYTLPTIGSVTTVQPSTNSISFLTSSPNYGTFNVLNTTTNITNTGFSGTTGSFWGLSPGTTYSFTVTAVGPSGLLGNSVTTTGTTTTTAFLVVGSNSNAPSNAGQGVYYTLDGYNWQSGSNGLSGTNTTTVAMQTMCWGANILNGGPGWFGTLNNIGNFNSTDGINWNLIYTPVNISKAYTICTTNGNRIVAGLNSSFAGLYYSDDGGYTYKIGLLASGSTFIRAFYVTYANNLYIAVGQNTTDTSLYSNMMTSPDGITWTNINTLNGQTNILFYVTYFPNVGGSPLWVATGRLGKICASTTGTSGWYVYTTTTSIDLYAIVTDFNGSNFVLGAISSPYILYSTSGLNGFKSTVSTPNAASTKALGYYGKDSAGHSIWCAGCNGKDVIYSINNGANWTRTPTSSLSTATTTYPKLTFSIQATNNMARQ